MTFKNILLIPSVFVVLNLLSAARADPCPMGAGAILTPTADTQIELAREVLTIDIGQYKADVRATVTLVNHGPMVEQQVGFPCAEWEEIGGNSYNRGVPCDIRISVTVDG